MEELSKEKLGYLLEIMKQNSIQYSIDNNSYEIRLIHEIQQACKQIMALIEEAYKIPDTSEREKELEEIIIAMQGELDKVPNARRVNLKTRTVQCPTCKYEFRLPELEAILKKPKVTEGVIEEKAREFQQKVAFFFEKRTRYVTGEIKMVIFNYAKDFIRSLYAEMPAKKVSVTEEKIKRYATDLVGNAYYDDEDRKIKEIEFFGYPLVEKKLKQIFKELGVEVVQQR